VQLVAGAVEAVDVTWVGEERLRVWCVWEGGVLLLCGWMVGELLDWRSMVGVSCVAWGCSVMVWQRVVYVCCGVRMPACTHTHAHPHASMVSVHARACGPCWYCMRVRRGAAASAACVRANERGGMRMGACTHSGTGCRAACLVEPLPHHSTHHPYCMLVWMDAAMDR